MDEEEYTSAIINKELSPQPQLLNYVEERERGLIEIQLEVDSIKEEIFHLLRQDTYIPNSIDGIFWKELEKKEERILSDWGIKRIMQIIGFYINKNVLMTNLDDKQINKMMFKLMVNLNELLLLNYEKLFDMPSIEECKKIIIYRISEKIEIENFSKEFLINKNSINYEDILKSLKVNVEEEVEKIRREIFREKLKEYGILLNQLEAIVYVTLNRAWKGEERNSIRRHSFVNELRGRNSNELQQKEVGKGGLFGFLK